MILLDHVRKRYGDFSLAIDLEIEKKELVSILGPSGSGKTSALRLIAGFEKPDSGRVIIDGEDVTGLDPAKRSIGFVFQDYTLFPHLDVGGNVAYGLIHKKGFTGDVAERVRELLSMVNLSGFRKRKVGTLSGGEQQRAAIARALAPAPRLFLLDEPFSAIDAPLRRELRDGIARLQRELGVTTVFVTHSRQEALSISDRVAIMRNGSIVQFDTPENLYHRPENRFVAEFTGEANFFQGTLEYIHDGAFGVRGFTDLTGSLQAVRDLPAAPGAEVTVMVRPNHIRFADDTADSGRNVFTAELAEKKFFGHFYEYRFRCGDTPVMVYDDTERTTGRVYRLCIEPDRLILLGQESG